ncbi:hypothetical protein PIB30_063657 [Stylosanthes scabra]|uniref:Uncharacterized protein n=1 Tax=Stylosanthes scabra TaxID=79078 RepID=A0ABU6YKD7_9FABA|nr:hypothetical protein [Stylosanthes scabra]
MAENPRGDHGVAAQEAEMAQMPHELPFIYRWVTNDVLGVLSVLTQGYLDKLKISGVIIGGRDLEQCYRIEATRHGERVCYPNMDHPIVPNWLWVNENREEGEVTKNSNGAVSAHSSVSVVHRRAVLVASTDNAVAPPAAFDSLLSFFRLGSVIRAVCVTVLKRHTLK